MSDYKAYSKTSINHFKTQEQLSKILKEHKISDIAYMDKSSEKQIIIVFKTELQMEGKSVPVGVKIVLPNVVEDNRDSKYRVLFWYLKSKFEAIDSGLFEDYNTSFVKEFYPHLMVGRGQTLYESLAPQLNNAMLDGKSDKRLELNFG